ncbi:MAG: hypothetical protein BGO12_09565 [Verrucomicrobia bacterium 61-8]|nr:hypothetical protein [Verrucomicrobiota bacterium]OJV25359.1 MAG: hypothetical protein BGO12_09565 [Verrucomicrobia bacterium 61-8]
MSAAVAWCAVVVCLLPACASRSPFQKGYERGASDTVKRQYWILQDMQKREDGNRSKPRLSLYRIPVMPDPEATVKTVPYEITVPVIQ